MQREDREMTCACTTVFVERQTAHAMKHPFSSVFRYLVFCVVVKKREREGEKEEIRKG